jgi:hypothetical protein
MSHQMNQPIPSVTKASVYSRTDDPNRCKGVANGNGVCSDLNPAFSMADM